MNAKFLFLIKLLAILLLSFLHLPNIIGQHVQVSSELTIASNINYDVLGQFGKHTILSAENGSKMTLYSYDKELQSILPYQVTSPHKRADLIAYAVYDTTLYIYYTYPDSSKWILSQQRINLMENNISENKVIAKFPNYLRADLPMVVSDDHSYHLLRLGNKSSVLNYYLFNTLKDTLQQLIVTGNDFPKDNEFYANLLSNQGVYYILNSEHKSKEWNFELFRSDVDVKNEQFKFIIPENLSDLRMYSYQNQLILTGLYKDQKELFQLGMFFIDLNQIANLSPEYHKVPFNDTTIRDFYGGETQKQAGIEDLRLKQVLAHHDGSVTLLMEQTKEVFRTNMPGRNAYLPGAQSIDYYVENIIVGTVTKQFEADWQRVLHKKQYSYDDEAAYSSYFIHENPSAIRLLYNDEIRRSNTISEYIVSATGNVQRRVLFNTDYSDLNLLIRNSTQVGSASTIIPSIKKNKLRLVELNYE